MNANPYRVIGRGFNGWHAQAIDMSSSGGSLENYLKDAAEGALVYDAQDANYDAFVRHVIHGPMCDPALEPTQAKLSRDMWSANRITNADPAGTFHGFDYVGVGIFERLLRKIPGMKVGNVVNREIVWS